MLEEIGRWERPGRARGPGARCPGPGSREERRAACDACKRMCDPLGDH